MWFLKLMVFLESPLQLDICNEFARPFGSPIVVPAKAPNDRPLGFAALLVMNFFVAVVVCVD
jgi:hypothetical protein